MDEIHNSFGEVHLPVSVALYTHRVAAIGQHDLAIQLHTNITFFFSVGINFSDLPFLKPTPFLVLCGTNFFLFPLFYFGDSPLKVQ